MSDGGDTDLLEMKDVKYRRLRRAHVLETKCAVGQTRTLLHEQRVGTEKRGSSPPSYSFLTKGGHRYDLLGYLEPSETKVMKHFFIIYE